MFQSRSDGYFLQIIFLYLHASENSSSNVLQRHTLFIIILLGILEGNMNKTASISLRIEPETKSLAEKIYNNLGITLADAINIFLKRSIAEGGLPFELKQYPPNKLTIDTIEKANKGEDLHGPFNSIDELMNDLNA